MRADLLITNGIIVTMDAARRILRGAVAVTGDRITAILPAGEGPLPPAARTIDASGHAVIPGLINAHDHLRNLAPGVSVASGLKLDAYLRALWKLQRHMTAEDFRLGALLACVKLLKTGCTTVVDHAYPYHLAGIDAACLAAYRASGIRWYYARGIMTMPYRPLCESRQGAFRRIEELLDKDGVPPDRLMVAPVSFRQATPNDFRASRRLADRRGLRLYTHIAETKDEVGASLKAFGLRPVEHLHTLGWTGKDVTLVHCVLLTAREIGILEKTGTAVVHCPSNHMKLAKGITKVPLLLGRGVPVCLGVDGMDNLLVEMRLELLMQSLANLDPAILKTETALEMATRNGARAVGAEADLGSIEVGKKADMATVALNRAQTAPMLNVLYALIHMAHPGDVGTVVVDGRVVVEGGKVAGVDEEALCAEVQGAARAYLQRAGHAALVPPYC
jgi:cytosine/adenosine deaminase-related metal-dependent hydrolase